MEGDSVMDMRGSGIYSYDVDINVSCPNEECDFDDLANVVVDDWKAYHFTCPKCDYEGELENDTPF
jgi:hypothetical protein